MTHQHQQSVQGGSPIAVFKKKAARCSNAGDLVNGPPRLLHSRVSTFDGIDFLLEIFGKAKRAFVDLC